MSNTHVLPSGWREARLSDIADIRFSNVDKKTTPGEASVRLCNYVDVYNNEYVTSGLDFMEATATPSEMTRFAVQQGDVIITKDSETPDDIGVPAIVLDEIPGLVCGYHLALIKPNKQEVEPIFVGRQIGHERIAHYFSRLANGSTRYGLSASGVENAPLHLPPLPEQRKIASILTTVDGLIEKTESLIAKYQSVKQGLMGDLFTRGVDQHGHLRPTYDEAPELYKESELGWIPKEWEVRTTEAVSAKLWIGLVTTMTKHYVPEGVKLIRNQNIRNNFIDRLGMINLSHTFADLYENRKLRTGDVVTVHTGDVGTSALIQDDLDGAHGFATINTRVNESVVLNQYVCYFYNSINFRRQVASVVTGDGRDNLNLKDFVKLLIPCPKSKGEQKTICDRMKSCDNRRVAEQRQLRKLGVLKTGLMQDLLTGKVRVHVDGEANQDG